MAKRSQGNGWIIAAVFLGFGFMICLVLAIIFNTQISAAKQEAEKAQRELRRFVSAAEQRAPDIETIANTSGNQTVVGVLAKDNRDLKNTISGQDNTTFESIRQRMESFDVTPPLLTEIERLRKQEEADARLVSELTEASDIAKEERDVAQAAKAQVEKNYQSSLQTLAGQLTEERDKFQAFRQSSDNEFKSIETRLETAENNSSSRIAELEQENIELQQEANLLRDRLQGVIGERTSASFDPRVLADGEVISVVPDEGLCYINLGRGDHLVLGMTFEVFPIASVIRLESVSLLERGRATIEVIDIADNSATCRIVRQTPRDNITAGDVIANIIYEPNANIKFKIHGEFDIDNVGQASRTDRRRIESLVEEWGGFVASELSYDIDYLVLGVEPELPEPLSSDTIDPVQIAQHAAAVKKYEEYVALIKEAKSLTIPVLNQNRFLVLSGYYRR